MRNFEGISFNIGPTLFSWMQEHHPDTCRQIIEQDHYNLRRYGVGNALAQAYNHTILPLGNYQDKVTQVYWGIADFEHRFGRRPQGMWLPEAAVDMETLEVLARHGIEFTILAPWSARADQIDPTEPYRVNLPGGRSITVFFYQRELSARISFDPGATTNADSFAQYNILSGFQKEKLRRNEPQMVIIASDGELYGHHQYMRDRFLARLVDGGGFLAGMQTTFPALWLLSHPPRQTMEIREPTSWSCHHGVRRWVGDCACTPNDGRSRRRTPGRGGSLMAIKGSLKEASLPDVLQLLALGQKSGCLSVADRANFGSIYFERGLITFASIVNRPDRLGDILVKHGRLTTEQLEAAIARQGRERHRRLGQILVEEGLLSSGDLDHYVRFQIEEAVYLLFT